MRFSEKWLREWVNPKVSTETLVSQLTMAGLEVDAVEPVAGEFSQVVVGEILFAEAHPDAKKLQLCKVGVGQDEPLSIVCGAPNAREGIKVAVALVGAALPNGIKIKATTIRGQASQGMLCAEAELAMSEESAGIIELPHSAPIGSCFRAYLELDDTAIEVDLTPNRGDCLSLLGMARETALLNQMPLIQAELPQNPVTSDRLFPVNVLAPEACPRYLGRVVENVDTTAATPVWMQERLRRSGIRSIDVIVDITNYVMLELGQPMHAFDLDHLSESIIVRYAKTGESLQLLNGQLVELSDDSLIIADQKQPLALAGVMGGSSSAIEVGKTQSIFLECAFFDPVSIAGKARAYGLHTDSSHRFERGVDFNLPYRAMARATELITTLAGGRVGPITDLSSETHLQQDMNEIHLRQKRVDGLLGFNMPREQIETILSYLGLKWRQIDDGWWVEPISHRFDIRIEVDLIEELGRVFGYNNLPIDDWLNPSKLSHLSGIETKEALTNAEEARLTGLPDSEGTLSVQQIKEAMVVRGFQEVITYSFVDPEWQNLLTPELQPIPLANPISADMSVMRSTLWAGLLKAASYNLSRQEDRLRIFETGLRFRLQTNGDIEQQEVISGLVCGQKLASNWCHDKRCVDFFDIKDDVVSLFSLGGLDHALEFEQAEHAALQPGQTAKIWLRAGAHDLLHVGWLGALHPNLEVPMGISGNFGKDSGKVYLFELILNPIRLGNIPQFTEVSKFPSVSRDLAIVVDSATPSSDLLRVVKEKASQWLTDVSLFDLYEGDNIGERKKSIAVSLTLQHTSRTLHDDEVNAIIDDVIMALTETFQVTMRR